MSEFIYFPNHDTKKFYHSAMREHIEGQRTEYKKQILHKAAGILLHLEQGNIEPDAQIDTVKFVGKESRATIDRTDNCWIITEEPVTRKDVIKINSRPTTKSKKIGNIIPLLVAKRGFVLTDNVRLILPYSSLTAIGQQPTLIYSEDSYNPDFVEDKNIGKDGYIDTGIVAGLDRLFEQAVILSSN